MKAVYIQWDIDEDDDVSLPNEIDIPADITDIDEISDYISDVTGFCHTGFQIEYEEAVSIPGSEIDRVNRLLEIKSLEEMSNDELLSSGANTNWCEGIFAVKFADGSSLNFDLCSGSTNYFDDVVWMSADGSHDVVLECAYELDDIEFEHEGILYYVRIVRE